MRKTTEIALCPLEDADSEILYSWINDRDTALFNNAYKPVQRPQHQSWFDDVRARSDLFIFAIRLLLDQRIIGTCQLHSLDWVSRSAELQIRIGGEADRGHGYGSAAVILLLGFAFEDLNLHRVYLHILRSNTRALKVYEKVGFTEEGILRKAAFVNGRFVDVVCMALLRDEYGTD